MTSKKISRIAMLSCVAIIFGYIESLFPIPIPIPGVKLGLSNIVVLFALYLIDGKSAWFIMFIKVLVSSLLFSGINTFIYSIAGGILSVGIMMFLKSTEKFNIITVSVVGAILHNFGQLIAATIILGNINVTYYLPFLIIAGVVVGFLIGNVSKLVINRKNMF